MAHIEFVAESDIPAARILAAAADFSADRPALWPTIEPAVYRVHETGDTWAEATEGSRFLGTIWARERYDWSIPGTIRATVIDSNVFRPGGTWELTANDVDGGTRILVRSRRQARNPRGRLLGALLALAGRRIQHGNLQQTLRLLGDGRRATGAPK